MNKLYHNDQAHIAEDFLYADEHTTQTARLAYFKINSYKLSLVNAAFCMSRDELTGIIRNTLLNYISIASVLLDTDFFNSPIEN